MKWIHQKKIGRLIIKKDIKDSKDELIYSSPTIKKDIRKLILYIIIFKNHIPDLKGKFMTSEYKTREWSVILHKQRRENYIFGAYIYVRLLSTLVPIKVIRAKYYWEKNRIEISWG